MKKAGKERNKNHSDPPKKMHFPTVLSNEQCATIVHVLFAL